jgi:hypothetical protein
LRKFGKARAVTYIPTALGLFGLNFSKEVLQKIFAEEIEKKSVMILTS